MLNLEAAFQILLREPLPEDGQLLASHLLDLPRHRIAIDGQGAPIIMIATSRNRTRARLVPIKLENLSLQHNVACRITGINGSIEEGQFTVIACLGTDRALHTYFLRVLEPILLLLGPTPNQTEIASTLNNLIELFRVMAAVPLKSVQGLWAELFLIARAPNPANLVEAWHTTPGDRYDFSRGDQRIEVKGVTGRIRRHHFSLEQLLPPQDTVVLIASLFIERAGAGTSLAEMTDIVRIHLGGNLDLLITLDRIVGMTLGNSWRQAIHERFDFELAVASLEFYESIVIPSLPLPVV
jgi:hypothetical protein